MLLFSSFFVSYFFVMLALTHYRPAMPFGNRKNTSEDLLISVLSQLKKNHSSGNLKFNYLGIFQSLKLHILMEKNPFHFS